MRYRVEIDGKTVWQKRTKAYEGLAVFPIEHRSRPRSGEVRLFIDDECIGVQTPLEV